MCSSSSRIKIIYGLASYYGRCTIRQLGIPGLCKLPGMRAEDSIILSDIRQVPTDDLLSEELVSDTRTWWLQVVAE